MDLSLIKELIEKQKGAISLLDIKEKVTTFKISDNDVAEYDLSEAKWINDKELIAPCHSIRGFVIINVDGNINKIKDVENGTEDPLNGLRKRIEWF